MRDPLAELSFETAGNVVVGRVEGEIGSVNAEELCDIERAAPIDATVEGALESLGERT